MEGLGPMVVLEHLTSLGKQSLDMLPSPLGPRTDDAPAPRLFRNHAGLFDLLESLAEWRLVVPLRPTEPMDAPLPSPQIQAKAFRITPLAAPPRSLGPMAALTGTAPPGTLGPGGHIGPSHAQHQGRTAPGARCRLR